MQRSAGLVVNILVVARPGDRASSTLLDALAELSNNRPEQVGTLHDAQFAIRSRQPDVIVFDPNVTGGEFAGDVRRTYPAAPVVVGWLSTRSSSRAAELLDNDVDDVVDASMRAEEITARIRSRLRRVALTSASALAFGGLRVDARLREASWAGDPLPLTPREIEVLQVLTAAAGRTVRREVIYQRVWGWSMPRGDRAVDVNVKRLRNKLAKAKVGITIATHSGVGYRLEEPADQVVTRM